MTSPRYDSISWDEYFMYVAQLSAQRSKDPSTQVGACIVDKNNHILATGYNGFPKGIANDALPWSREGGVLDTKYAFMCHAESNAIDNRGCNSLEGARMYVSLYPCNECAKRIIQNGINEVIYLSNKYVGKDSFIAAPKMFELSGVSTRQLQTYKKSITLDLT